jgi:nucleotide-binding universal stress UspA family protein
MEAAKSMLNKAAEQAKKTANVKVDLVIREGVTSDEIVKLIEEDADIGILALAAGIGKEGPGPLVSNLAKTAGAFPIPVAIVPGHLSDDDIDASS